jgi:microcystin-dependent protein
VSQPYVGQVIAVGFNFAPVGWQLCNGQSLPISEYQVLYTLIGTTFGGDGQTTFNVPNLCGRGVIGMGQGTGLSNYVIGQQAGTEGVTLTSNQTGAHTHMLNAAATATNSGPATNEVLGTAASAIYFKSGGTVTLAPSTVGPAPGGSQPHENRQPFQTVNYIICWAGIYPPHP